MTTYFSWGESAVPHMESWMEIGQWYEIDVNNKSMVTLRTSWYKTNFKTNEGDKFFEHNNLLYIETKEGRIISWRSYKWDNSLIRHAFPQFEDFFWSVVQALQIDKHASLMRI